MDAVQTDGLKQTKFISPGLRDDIVLRPRLPDSLHSAIKNHAITLAPRFVAFPELGSLPKKKKTTPRIFCPPSLAHCDSGAI